MLQESEPTPEQQYQPTETRRWQVGDLINHREYGRCLLIMADCWPTCVRFISENGQLFDMAHPHEFSRSAVRHNTGLQYIYSDQGNAERDFKNGLFTPYFEIL